MRKTVNHPTRDLLEKFHRGLLFAPQATALEAHLNDCDECLQTLESMPDDSALVQLIRGLDIGVSDATPIPGELRFGSTPTNIFQIRPED